ncbi:MAG: hypothetical protein L0956_01960 [Candidatus Mariimomonas ferrooxydans]
MSPSLGIVIMMNNYFHDVATALLLASSIVMWLIVKKLGNSREDAVIDYFLNLYNSVTRLAKFSLAWIIIGGIPRTIFYTEFEWANAAGKDQISALIVKHILAFIFVSNGAYVWIKLHKRVKGLRKHIDAAK